jgi:hypothetical protein
VEAFYGLTVAFTFLSVVIAFAFASLCSFHTYLLFLGQSTAEWITAQHGAYQRGGQKSAHDTELAKRRAAEIQRRREMEQEEWLARREGRRKRDKLADEGTLELRNLSPSSVEDTLSSASVTTDEFQA